MRTWDDNPQDEGGSPLDGCVGGDLLLVLLLLPLLVVYTLARQCMAVLKGPRCEALYLAGQMASYKACGEPATVKVWKGRWSGRHVCAEHERQVQRAEDSGMAGQLKWRGDPEDPAVKSREAKKAERESWGSRV
jgi:hypothetical protein